MSSYHSLWRTDCLNVPIYSTSYSPQMAPRTGPVLNQGFLRGFDDYWGMVYLFCFQTIRMQCLLGWSSSHFHLPMKGWLKMVKVFSFTAATLFPIGSCWNVQCGLVRCSRSSAWWSPLNVIHVLVNQESVQTSKMDFQTVSLYVPVHFRGVLKCFVWLRSSSIIPYHPCFYPPANAGVWLFMGPFRS